MGFAIPNWKYPKFKLKDLNKKIGQLIFVGPSESDLAEGNFTEQLWFRDDKNNMYLILENDLRKKKDE